MDFTHLLNLGSSVERHPETPVSYQSPRTARATQTQTPRLADKQFRSPTSTDLSPYKNDEVSWPESAERDALTLFDGKKIDAQMKKELVVIYCIYIDFERNEGNASLDKKVEKTSDYFRGHSAQRKILQSIFPMKDNLEQRESEKKAVRYMQYCSDLQLSLDKIDYEAQAQALKAHTAVMTLAAAAIDLKEASI